MSKRKPDPAPSLPLGGDNAIPAKHAPCPRCNYYMGDLSAQGYPRWFCTKCGWGGTEAERLAAGQKPRDETP